MQTIKKIVLGIFLCSLGAVFGQNTAAATNNIDGVYSLLFVERDGAKKKLIQLAENNGSKVLAIAACPNCMPALYAYEPEESERIGKPVYFNEIGLYVITYDAESFAIVMLSAKEGENFSYVNFYSKNQSTVKSMTKEKVEAYVLKY